MKANPKPQTCLLKFFQGNEISFSIIIPIDSPDMGGLHIRKFLWPASLQGFWGFLSSLETFLPFKRATEEERAASCGPKNQVSAFSSPQKKNSGNNFDETNAGEKLHRQNIFIRKTENPATLPKGVVNKHARREFLTFLDGFDWATSTASFVHGLLILLGRCAGRLLPHYHRLPVLRHWSYTCHGSFFLLSFFTKKKKNRTNNSQKKHSIHQKRKWFQKRTTYSFSMSCLLSLSVSLSLLSVALLLQYNVSSNGRVARSFGQ